MNDFTIFITSYNYGRFIGRAIESVINQTHPGWNLFILDNGSTDNTFDVVEPYLADPRITLIKRPVNLGSAKNITMGFLELEGKFISTLAADDWLESIFVEKALRAFSENPEIPLAAFGWMAYVDADETLVSPHTIPYPKSFSGLAYLSPHLTLGNFVPVHLMAFRKSVIDFIFKEMLDAPLRQMGEQYVIKRLEDRYGPSYFSSEVAGYWRRHEAQQTFSNANSFASGIENVIEPLLYVQGDNQTHKGTRFLSLIVFLTLSSKTPYRFATEWLLSESGQHFANKHGIAIGNDANLYRCLACGLMMGHHTLATSQFISAEEIHLWLMDIQAQFGLTPEAILELANQAYGNYLYPAAIGAQILEHLRQSGFQPRVATTRRLPEMRYDKWLSLREIIPEDDCLFSDKLGQANLSSLQFHLILRLQPGDETNLADTLDSLIQQRLSTWHLDILTTLPSPEALEDIPCIGWHTLGKPEEAKEAIDFLANARKLDWLFEIPAGARLDPLCLWRLATQAKEHPEARAFFVDDDCCNKTGKRHSPRFKPGCNPGALQSADLAGPVCLRQDAWQATGGASQRDGSPWFSQLLRVAGKFSWAAIKHIPDVLISYSSAFPSDPESCILGLLDSFREKGIDGEIVPTGGQSWGIRFPLGTPPKVTVAIVSGGQLDLLSRCLASIVDKTRYPEFEILIALGTTDDDPDLNAWLSDIQQRPSPRISVARSAGNYSSKCNAAVNGTANEFVALIRDEAVIIQANWLEELVRSCLQPDIVGASPRLITPGDGLIQNAGNVLGLKGIVGSPYDAKAKLGEPGYLDCLLVARDVSTLPAACMLIRKTDYQAVDGMDETALGDHFAEVDLCQKLRQDNRRLLFQPMATVVYDGSAELTIAGDAERQSRQMLTESRATRALLARWQTNATVDPYWNPNLSLAESIPTLETDFRAQWQFLPSAAPRFLARPLTNGQGVFRITSPLRALRKAGLASECIWNQEGPREPSNAELARLAPDTVIVQHYVHDRFLAALQSWNQLPDRPFIVHSIDDLLTDMAESNPFRKNVPANSRARLKYTFERCDRLVVSTEFLADAYRHMISDIVVVPNRLEQDIWLPLHSQRRAGPRPRIGWAGGTTHHGDLVLLKEIIEQTRHEADWVFFGMCPDEIRPLIAEFHPFAEFSEYPARLAALNLDIGVAPLAQIPFNQGKSNLRLLEYGVLGIPVVCTDIDPYRGSPARCVANTASAWIQALRERIHDADAREREGNLLRQWVHQGYLLENHMDQWLNAHLPPR